MGTLWTVWTRNGERSGVDAAGLQEMLRSGEAAPHTTVRRHGDARWQPITSVPEVALAVARAEYAARGHDPADTPPPPPGEPWFYNVAPRRAVLLHLLSAGLYSFVWSHRHRTFLERRAGPVSSPFWQLRYDRWLPGEVATAAQRLGLLDEILLDVRPLGDTLLVLSAVCPPVAVAIGFAKASDLQSAAEVVNRAVAPGAPRPPMDVGEWVSVSAGLCCWIALPLLAGLEVLLR